MRHMSSLLQIDNLKTWFPIRQGVFSRTTGHIRAVDGVSMCLEKGTTIGLVGESGCGKSTLARTVMRLEPATAGNIFFNGQDILSLNARSMKAVRRNLQMVFQDPFSSLNPRMNVMDIVTEGMLEHGLIRRRERREAAIRLLQDVGMGAHALHRYPHEFSGGQRQRISIARALSLQPQLIICDEAVSALDVSIQAQVINLLMDLRDRYGLSYLFISHDLGVVRHIADTLCVMYLGTMVEQGPAQNIIDHPCHPYTRALISAIPRIDGNKHTRIILHGDVPSPSNPPSGCRFHPRCPLATEMCRRQQPPLQSATVCEKNRLVACFNYSSSSSFQTMR